MDKRRLRQILQKRLLATLHRYRESDSKPSETFVEVLNLPVGPLDHCHGIARFHSYQRDIAGDRNAVGTK